MKKILAIFIFLLLTLSLASCGESKYPPVESTEEETRVVFTVTIDGEKYDVKYELYRALFTSLKSSVDGGDDSVWTGESKDEYIEKIDALILDHASEIYASLHICKKNGIDVYSDKFDEKIEEFIEIGVEGGEIDGVYFEGFGGDYEKYLKSLEDDGVNYSVQELMLRYSIATDTLTEYYAGNTDGNDYTDGAVMGAIKYTEDDIKSFYNSEECVRVIYAYLSSVAYKPERVEQIRDAIAAKSDEDAVISYIIQYTTLGASDIKAGMLIAKYNLDPRYYAEITDGAFELSLYETSEVYEFKNGSNDAYIILYRTDKDLDYFEKNYDKIVSVYLNNEIGKIIDETKLELIKSVSYTEYLNSLDRSEIK